MTQNIEGGCQGDLTGLCRRHLYGLLREMTSDTEQPLVLGTAPEGPVSCRREVKLEQLPLRRRQAVHGHEIDGAGPTTEPTGFDLGELLNHV